MTVAELLARIDSRELSEWRAYDRLAAEDAKSDGLAAKAARGLATRKVGGRHRVRG